MTCIIAVANQKGGVGKTTTSVNLASALASLKRKVMLIDLDPQGNATTGVGIEKQDEQINTSNTLLGKSLISESLVHSAVSGIDVLPGGPSVSIAEFEMMHMDDREFMLAKALEPVVDQYEFIIIDCPPSLNMLTVNALVAANNVLIPMQCEYYALEGLSALLNTIEKIKTAANPQLKIMGLLRTMYDLRNNLGRDVSDQLSEYFGDQLYNTVIPRNVRLAEAPSHGQPVITYDRYSRGALAYLALAAEILRKQPKQNNAEVSA